MNINKIFLSLNAKDFSGLSEWWSKVLERKWDREPMPSCHEWQITNSVLFQVLDQPESSGSTIVSLHIANLDGQIERLRLIGIQVPEPVKIEGFETLRYCKFEDPEGNEVGLLEGE